MSYNTTLTYGPGPIDSLFVSPDCVSDVYEEESEQKWISCAAQRGKVNVITAGIVVAVMLVIALFIIPTTTGKIIAIVVAAVVMGGAVYSGIVNAEWTARYQFVNSRKELAAAGYDASIPYSPQERIEKRAAAVNRLRVERQKEQEIAAIGRAGTAIASALLPGRRR